MTSPILSQSEINALLHTASTESLSSDLKNVLTSVAHTMGRWLATTTGSSEINGPYIERLSQELGQSVNEESVVVLADIGTSEVLVLMSLADASVLTGRFERNPLPAFQKLSHAWVAELAQMLGVSFQVYQAQSINPAALEGQAVTGQTFAVRHLLDPKGGSLELTLIVKADYLEQVIKKGDLPSGIFVGGTPKSKVGKGRLIKGNAPSQSPVSEASFSPLELPIQGSNIHGIALLEDIDLLVTVELGRVVLTLNEVLELKPQTVIRLNRHAGEPVDVFINANRAAKGEVVVLEERFGVRILEILPKSQRIQGE